jgi:hypothetical protein
MGPRSRTAIYRRAIVCAVFAAGLGLGACGGDDDDASGGGSSGTLNLSGTTSDAGSSTGAITSGGSNAQGAAPADAGAGGEGVTMAGSANGGSASSGGSASGGNAFYLPCAAAADCKQFGGGKVCCDQGSMVFCTKPSACSGKTLP